MAPIDNINDLEVKEAIERMEKNLTWGKFMFRANPLNTIYYAFTHRYVTEAYLLKQHAIQLTLDEAHA